MVALMIGGTFPLTHPVFLTHPVLAGAPSPSPFPSASPSPFPMGDVDWGTLVNQIAGIFSGVAQHPTISGIAIGVVGIFLSALFIFLKKKFDAWQIANANAATNAGTGTFVDVNTNTNTNNTNTDNTGRGDLNNQP
jgi:hypothetical protein